MLIKPGIDTTENGPFEGTGWYFQMVSGRRVGHFPGIRQFWNGRLGLPVTYPAPTTIKGSPQGT